ncbi:hypothetical protein BH09MYX1_BH09MYX1_08790 [soil metagenome]
MIRSGLALAAAILLSVCCHDSPPPETPAPPGALGAQCALAGKSTRECAAGLVCKERPEPPSDPDAGHVSGGPEIASAIGGPCGGPAGFHCGGTLGCDMSRNAYGAELGTCVRASECAAP